MSCIQSQAAVLYASKGSSGNASLSSSSGDSDRLGLEEGLEAKEKASDEPSVGVEFAWMVPQKRGVKLDDSRRNARSGLNGWVTLVGDTVLLPRTGVYTWEVVLNNIDTEKNVFGCVVGIVPEHISNTTNINQPIGWKKVEGWGLIVGIGKLLHKSTGKRYRGTDPISFRSRDQVGVRLDTNRGVLSFYKNGRCLGEAFDGIWVPVRAALSCIQSQDTSLNCSVQLSRRGLLELSPPSLSALHKDELLAKDDEESSDGGSGGGSGDSWFRWGRPPNGEPAVSDDGLETRGTNSSWRTLTA